MYEQFQKKIRNNILKIKGDMTHAELAKRSGVSEVTVSVILSGKRNISLYTLWAIANGLGVNIRELVR